MNDGDRYARQRQLAEVGADGQQCLESTIFYVPQPTQKASSGGDPAIVTGETTVSGEPTVSGEFTVYTCEIAATYARAMGMQVAAIDATPASTAPPSLSESLRALYRHSAPREVGHGAALVLAQALSSLNITAPPPHDV